MSCDELGGDYLGAVGEQNFVDAFVCTYGDTGSTAAAAVVFWFVIATMLYVKTGSASLPAVMTILLGAAVISQMPAVGAGFAGAMILTVIGVITVIVARRMGV